jgi:uncharacterized protein (TIGR02466 family)
MAKVELWFPTAIYIEENLISEEQNDLLVRHCLDIKNNTDSGGGEWLGKTYNTHGTHDLSKDDIFRPILDLTAYHVHQFANMHNCTGSYENNYAWMNIAEGSAWQEFHTHNGNVFAAVYYAAAPEGAGRILFEDPKEPDMCPLKTKENRNQLSYSRIGYNPKPRSLMIFRAYLRHCVEPGTNKEPRISIAMNFN